MEKTRSIEERLDRIEALLEGRCGTNMSIGEAAEYTKLSISTLYGKTARHEVPHHKIGSRLVFRQRELDAWMDGTYVRTRDETDAEAARIIARRKRNL